MANMFEKYAADREAEQKKIEGERQEGAEDDGGGARDDDCRDYPRVGCGARSEGLVRR